VTLTTGAKRVAIIVFWAGMVVSALDGGAIAADKNRSARAHTEAARAYFNLEKYREAIAEYEHAYLDKQDPAYFFEIAECHRLLGDFAEAQRFYKRYLQDAPRNHVNRPAAEARMPQMAEATAEAERERQAAAASAPSAPPLSPQGGSRPLPPSFPPSSHYLAPLPPSGSAAPPVSLASAPAGHDGPTGAATPAQPTSPPTPAVSSEAPGSANPSFVSTAPNHESASGPATLVAAPAPAPSPSRPVYTRWWFWTIIGGAVVGGVAAGLVLASSSPSRPSCPVGVTCQ